MDATNAEELSNSNVDGIDTTKTLDIAKSSVTFVELEGPCSSHRMVEMDAYSSIETPIIPPKPDLKIGDWIVGKLIGQGSSGKVKLAKHTITGQQCVVKIVKRPKLPSGSVAREADLQNLESRVLSKIYRKELYMIREATISISLHHPHIVQLYSALLGDHAFYCFFEYAEGEDLVDYIARTGRMSESFGRHLFRQILSAVEYAHRNNVVHRDIKLENIRYNDKTKVVKILDFGFATFYHQDWLLDTNCGSPCYAPPEIYENRSYYGPEIDVWSLGICLYGMLVGAMPFEGDTFKILARNIRNGQVSYPTYLTEEVCDLIARILVVDPVRRASLKVLLHHPWVNKGSVFPPISVLSDQEKENKQTFTTPFVKSVMRSSICESGCILMATLKKEMLKQAPAVGTTPFNTTPEFTLADEPEPSDSLSESLEMTDWRSTFSTSRLAVMSQKMNSKSWWKPIKQLLTGFKKRKPVTIVPTPSEPTSRVALFTRLFHRREATASAFSSKPKPLITMKRMNTTGNVTIPRITVQEDFIPKSALARFGQRLRQLTGLNKINNRRASVSVSIRPWSTPRKAPLRS